MEDLTGLTDFDWDRRFELEKRRKERAFEAKLAADKKQYKKDEKWREIKSLKEMPIKEFLFRYEEAMLLVNEAIIDCNVEMIDFHIKNLEIINSIYRDRLLYLNDEKKRNQFKEPIIKEKRELESYLDKLTNQDCLYYQYANNYIDEFNNSILFGNDSNNQSLSKENKPKTIKM